MRLDPQLLRALSSRGVRSRSPPPAPARSTLPSGAHVRGGSRPLGGRPCPLLAAASSRRSTRRRRPGPGNPARGPLALLAAAHDDRQRALHPGALAVCGAAGRADAQRRAGGRRALRARAVAPHQHLRGRAQPALRRRDRQGEQAEPAARVGRDDDGVGQRYRGASLVVGLLLGWSSARGRARRSASRSSARRSCGTIYSLPPFLLKPRACARRRPPPAALALARARGGLACDDALYHTTDRSDDDNLRIASSGRATRRGAPARAAARAAAPCAARVLTRARRRAAAALAAARLSRDHVGAWRADQLRLLLARERRPPRRHALAAALAAQRMAVPRPSALLLHVRRRDRPRQRRRRRRRRPLSDHPLVLASAPRPRGAGAALASRPPLRRPRASPPPRLGAAAAASTSALAVGRRAARPHGARRRRRVVRRRSAAAPPSTRRRRARCTSTTCSCGRSSTRRTSAAVCQVTTSRVVAVPSLLIPRGAQRF